MALFPLLLEALATGAIRLEYGRISDRCGYIDFASRTIVLNPDATDEELEAELLDELTFLLEHPEGQTRRPAHVPNQRPALELLPGGGAANVSDARHSGRAASE